jgi:hypothetical protein
MQGCIRCHGPLDDRRKCRVCDRVPEPLLQACLPPNKGMLSMRLRLYEGMSADLTKDIELLNANLQLKTQKRKELDQRIAILKNGQDDEDVW